MKQKRIETPEHREKRRKFLLFLPVPILLFAALIFLAFGGGKGNAVQQNSQQRGINTELPSAQFKGEKAPDKMSLYDQAAKDSASVRGNSGKGIFASLQKDTSGRFAKYLSPGGHVAESNEAQISRKLAQIRGQLNKPPQTSVHDQAVTTLSTPGVNTTDIDRLEKMMQGLKSQQAEDPQMKQLGGMMDKIFQIQHPELVSQQVKKESPVVPDSLFKAIRAMVDGNQKVVGGASVRLKLLDTITLNGQRLPRGQLLYGLCQVNNQRLVLNIKNIRLGTSLLPVDLAVYDMDGMAGINAPEAITQDAMRSGSDNALQSLQYLPMNQTVTTQLTGAAVETTKSLFSKKVKVIKVKLKAGYPVLLRNNQTQH
jgi:hypothetical protein